MNVAARAQVEFARRWLRDDVFPLWTSEGIDAATGAFVEALDHEGQALTIPRRGMIQSRQIYSCIEAAKLGMISSDRVKDIVTRAMAWLLRAYSKPTGAFAHAADAAGLQVNPQEDLYAQAFALFGMANAYGVTHDAATKERAKKLLKFLRAERRAPQGGFTEIIAGKTLFQSNPHMHLFEAAVTWVQVDSGDSTWTELAKELYELMSRKFIDPSSGALAEHFTADWQPLREAGRFVFEPGHQYEWGRLALQFAALTGTNVGELPARLFALSEKTGIDPGTGCVRDEIWSDLSVKTPTSRFWPQSERAKAALHLGQLAAPEHQASYAKAADESVAALYRYFTGIRAGLWHDTLRADGQFVQQPVKASSLYHIIGALGDYIEKRPLLKD